MHPSSVVECLQLWQGFWAWLESHAITPSFAFSHRAVTFIQAAEGWAGSAWSWGLCSTPCWSLSCEQASTLYRPEPVLSELVDTPRPTWMASKDSVIAASQVVLNMVVKVGNNTCNRSQKGIKSSHGALYWALNVEQLQRKCNDVQKLSLSQQWNHLDIKLSRQSVRLAK